MHGLISLSNAASLVPGRPTSSTLWRWARKGIRTRDGQRVRLEHRRIGARVFTSEAWLDDFFRRCTEADEAYFTAAAEVKVPAPPVKSTSAQRRRQFADALAELEEAGL